MEAPKEECKSCKVKLPDDYYTPDYPVGSGKAEYKLGLDYITPILSDKELKDLPNIIKPYKLSECTRR